MFRGSIVALITPFRNGGIDEAALQSLVEWHIEQGMRCIAYGPPDVRNIEKRTHIAGFFTTVSCLVMCDHFRIEKVRMTEGYEQEIPYDQPVVWIMLDGQSQVKVKGIAEPTIIAKGQTVLLPAKMDQPVIKTTADCVWLEVTFPESP